MTRLIPSGGFISPDAICSSLIFRSRSLSPPSNAATRANIVHLLVEGTSLSRGPGRVNCRWLGLARGGSPNTGGRDRPRSPGRLPLLRAREASRVAGQGPSVGRVAADPRVHGLAAEARTTP